MATIKAQTRYHYKGKDYRRVQDLRVQVESEIGQIIDKVSPRLSPKTALSLLQVIIENRKELIDLLDMDVENIYNEGLHDAEMNIFDFNI